MQILEHVSWHNFASVSIEIIPIHRIVCSKTAISQFDEYWLFALHNIHTYLSVHGASTLPTKLILLLTVAQLIKSLGNFF